MTTEKELPKRKPNRLNNFDYSQNGAYFVTICAKNKEHIFGAVGASTARPSRVILSEYGKITDQAIKSITKFYPNVIVDKYVIMPNHIHMILIIQNESGRAMLVPTISTVIAQMKGYISKRIGNSIWQKSFYDHIIRNEQDYLEIWQYIENNPEKWQQDKFYTGDDNNGGYTFL